MKKSIINLFKYFGFDLKRTRLEDDFMKNIVFIINDKKIDLVLDVGANIGQFAEKLRNNGYRNRICSIEPMEQEFDTLLKKSSSDLLWDIYPRCAVGNQVGEIVINISQNSVSSSILPMLESHIDAAKQSRFISSEKVNITTLDSLFDDIISNHKNYLIKIDTQGYESAVLDGGPKTLNCATGVLIELSNVPLYQGQLLWKPMFNRLESLGFELWGIDAGFVNPNSGKMLQFDALFIKSK